MNNNTLEKIAKLVKEVCSEQSTCTNCPFEDGCTCKFKTKLNIDIPERWVIE